MSLLFPLPLPVLLSRILKFLKWTSDANCTLSTRYKGFLPSSGNAVQTPVESPTAIFCITVKEKEDVDKVLEACGEAGGKKDPTVLPEMPGGYGRSISDLDGHLWEVAWMGGMVGC
jgi:predicted lactoylglutathione lyase